MSRILFGLLLLTVSVAGWLSSSLCSFECWALFAGITVHWNEFSGGVIHSFKIGIPSLKIDVTFKRV